jgi:hypothetical protein
MNKVKKRINELRQTPKPIHEIKIQIFADNHIEVMGFPTNYHAAMNLMTAGLRRVANYFLAMAKDGKLDDKMNIKKSPITETKTPILGPDGKRLQ